MDVLNRIAEQSSGRRRIVGATAGAGAMLLARWTPALAQTPTPAPTRDIVDTAIAAGQFTTLVRAVQAAGLVDTLKGPGPFTVFAPNDAAFAKIPTEQLNAILTNREQLTKILTYHVVSGRVPASQVVTLTSANTVAGEPVQIAVQGSTVTLNGNSRVLQTDIQATNGIIHVIDTVLIPPSLSAPAPAPTAPAPTASNPNVARDGQTLAGQPQSVQQLFQVTWGDRAAARWAEEHNAELARAGR